MPVLACTGVACTGAAMPVPACSPGVVIAPSSCFTKGVPVCCGGCGASGVDRGASGEG